MDSQKERLRCPLRTSDTVLLVFTVSAVGIGIGMGTVLRVTRKEDSKLTPRQLMCLKFPGEIFVRALRMIIFPLTASCLITSIARLDAKAVGHIGHRVFLYYLSTTLIAVATGIVLVITISPGTRGSAEADMRAIGKRIQRKCFGGNDIDTIMDFIRNILPYNIAEATSHAERTCYWFQYKTGNQTRNLTVQQALRMRKHNTNERILIAIPDHVRQRGMNIIAVVVASIMMGIILGFNREKCRALLRFFAALEFAILKIVKVVMWYAPIGRMFLIAVRIIEIHDPEREFIKLGWYFLTVMTGMTIHSMITLILILVILGRRNPFKFVYKMSHALIQTLGIPSSSSTMPTTLKCLEDKIGIDPKVTRFMIPLGAIVNMDGTALYEAIAAIYISQYLGLHLNIAELVLTSLTATLASIGTAGIPGAGLVTLMMILIAVNLPTEFFVLIMPLDWFLDRIRTTVNVHGDSIGTAVVERLSGSDLKEYEYGLARPPALPSRGF